VFLICCTAVSCLSQSPNTPIRLSHLDTLYPIVPVDSEPCCYDCSQSLPPPDFLRSPSDAKGPNNVLRDTVLRLEELHNNRKQRAPAAYLVVIQTRGSLWFGVHQTRLLRKICRCVSDEVTGEQEGQIIMIKLFFNTKGTGEGKVLNGWTGWQLASVALQNLFFAGSYALPVVSNCK